MAIKSAVPDYDLPDTLELTSSVQVRAISNRLRTVVLGLLHERAATVTEIASAVGRPKSTVAYHVNVLHEAGLLRVVRTRRVRAIEERFFGRTARMFYVGVGSAPRSPGSPPLDFNDFDVAAGESQEAYRAQRLWSFIRHARIPPERAAEFWTKAMALVHEFDGLPRSGDTAYGFVVGIYPIPDYPVLPDPEE
jgi:DNA-binding transcriptional ArsR family regulator